MWSSIVLLLAVTVPLVTAGVSKADVNSYLRAELKKGNPDDASTQSCFWTEMRDKVFEQGTEPPFTTEYDTLPRAKLVCAQTSSCRAVTQETPDSAFILSDQRAAEADEVAVSWVRECEDKETPIVQARADSETDSGAAFLKIKVLTMDRFKSLKRLMDSLKDAYYDGDTVDIDFFVDFPPTKDATKLKAKLNARTLIINHLENWDWPYGRKHIHVRRICRSLLLSVNLTI